jgi:hypothetical protein
MAEYIVLLSLKEIGAKQTYYRGKETRKDPDRLLWQSIVRLFSVKRDLIVSKET